MHNELFLSTVKKVCLDVVKFERDTPQHSPARQLNGLQKACEFSQSPHAHARPHHSI